MSARSRLVLAILCAGPYLGFQAFIFALCMSMPPVAAQMLSWVSVGTLLGLVVAVVLLATGKKAGA